MKKNTWAAELGEGKGVGKVSPRKLESNVEVKKNTWAAELEGKEVGKIGGAKLGRLGRAGP